LLPSFFAAVSLPPFEWVLGPEYSKN